jgi:hypothetical protein
MKCVEVKFPCTRGGGYNKTLFSVVVVSIQQYLKTGGILITMEHLFLHMDFTQFQNRCL